MSLVVNSPLPLLVAGIATDDVNDAAAADDLALIANSLDACLDFHGASQQQTAHGKSTVEARGNARVRAANIG
jgi:hypothetical protein